MQFFKTEKEMFEYGKNLCNREFEESTNNGNRYFLCGTNLVFEDTAFATAEKALFCVAESFGLKNDLSNAIEKDCYCVSKIRDVLLETLEETLNVKIAVVCNEY